MCRSDRITSRFFFFFFLKSCSVPPEALVSLRGLAVSSAGSPGTAEED